MEVLNLDAFWIPIIGIVASFVLGIIVGLLSKGTKKTTVVGDFYINRGDPTKAPFWIEFEQDLDVIESQEQIGFKVVNHEAPDT